MSDRAVSEAQLRDKLKRWCNLRGQEFVARECGVSQPAISQMVNGIVSIGPSVFLAMGFRRVVTFIREPNP